MEWEKITIETLPEAVDETAALLWEMGIEGVEIEDGLIPSAEELGAMFVDPEPELAPDELPEVESPRLIFYLRRAGIGEDILPQEGETVDDSYTIHDPAYTPGEIDELLGEVQKKLEVLHRSLALPPVRIIRGESREEEWRDNWKQYFQPLLINDLLILPSWEEESADQKEAVAAGRSKRILLNPGTAFGSGTHESTRLCLDGLKKWQKGGERVLDIGCGSGILSLAALAYGAKSVIMTELDPACEGVIEENFILNKIDKNRYDLIMGNILSEDFPPLPPQDLLLCNILAPVICALAAPGAADRLAAPGAVLITSGIYRERQNEVEAAFEANPAWEWLETVRLGDWVSVVVRKRG